MDTYIDLNTYMPTIDSMHYIRVCKCKKWMDHGGFCYVDMTIGGLALITYMLFTVLCYKAFPHTFARITQKWEVNIGVQNLNGMQFMENRLLN